MKTLIPRAVSALKNFFNPSTPAKEQPETQIAPTFLDVLAQSMAHEAETNNFEQLTREKHKYKYNNIVAFLAAAGLCTLRVDEVRIKHMEQMRQWLHENIKRPGGSPISVDHTTRHLRLCRRAMYYAVDQEYISHNPIAGVKTKRSAPKDIFSLTVEEVRLFEGYHCKKIPQRNEIIHKFLYQCFTGLSHMDLPHDKHDVVMDFVRDNRGTKQPVYLITSAGGRGKTKRKYWAIYTEKARQIRELYPEGFPEIHLQTYNRTIKKVAKDLGIKHWDKITTHVGRKTFATLKREEGYSIPAIAVMLGNTEEVARKHYVGGDKTMLLAEYMERALSLRRAGNKVDHLSVA